ncbi:MAG: hypothetical protein K2X27_11500 [Candidatus Obscuribacterales bacterium]|nr:hypothetical protein [Candidatus Obscuribacterales bacterium]
MADELTNPPLDEAAQKIAGGASDKLNKAQSTLNSIDPLKFSVDHNGDGNADSLKIAMEQYSSTYAFRPDPQSKFGSPASAVCGSLQGISIPLGKEYLPPSLDSAIFGSKLESGDSEKLETLLVNRLNEMISKPGKVLSKSDLHSLLSRPETAAWMQADTRDYYIFSPDGESLDVGPKDYATAKCSWLQATIDHQPDGSSAKKAHLSSFFPLLPGQVNVIPDPLCFPYFPPFGLLYVSIDDQWKPGSGYNGCLGEVKVSHHSDVYLWGIAGP